MRYRDFVKNLNENQQQYRQMLQGMVKNDIIPQDVADRTITYARKKLLRNDRIVWWLKWFRIIITYDKIVKKLMNEPKDYDSLDYYKKIEDDLKKLFFKITKTKWEEIDNKTGLTIQDWNYNFGISGANIDHITGMFEEIPQLEQYQWNIDKTPSELLTDLRIIEREWQQSRKQWVKPQENDKIIDGLVYNNGSQAWVMLERGGCRDEGDAMGHCGNMPSQRPGDRILSFRTIRGEEHKPHLTFILHKNGMLGEMKGRANEKPNEKYHPYIIDLLKQPFIKGIAGGGYAPDNNFELSDLPTEQMETLLEQKPSLGGPVYMYKKNNRKYSPEIGESLKVLIDDYKTYIKFDIETGNIIVDTYGSMADIATELGDNVLEYVADVFNGDKHLDPWVSDDMITERSIINDIYVDLSDGTKEKLKNYIKNSDNVEDENRDDPIFAILDLIDNDDEVKDAFQSGIYTGVQVGTESEMYDSANSYLESNGFSRVTDDERENFPKGRKKDEWMLSTTAQTVLEHMMYGAYDTPDDLDHTEWKEIIEIKKMDEPYYGWDGWDSSAAAERTEEELDGILS